MRVLENLKPERVFYYFEEISRIPRGSTNTFAISEYCVNFAKERNLYVRRDEVNNVIIKKPATIGRENDTGVVIQGHLDMVCEKLSTKEHDFLKDGIDLLIEGDFVTADGTTLGADDGIAVAMALAILEDDTISHPHLDVIFTTDEEIGMDGAKAIDLYDIEGKYVFNIDCDIDGVAFAGCAGGITINTEFEYTTTEESASALKICVNGLKGGHSGAEIDKERANANVVLGRVLRELSKLSEFKLVSINGGTKDNVITRESEAIIICDNHSIVEKLIMDMNTILKNEYAATDENINVCVDILQNNSYSVIDNDIKTKVINYINAVPNGAQDYCGDIKGVVETSLNMGVVATSNNKIRIASSVRSMIRTKKYALVDKLMCISSMLGGTSYIGGDYPEWQYNRNSVLQSTMKETYRDLFDSELKIDVIHAGLECGYLLDKRSDFDIVSFGPQMYDIHTPDERLSISSTEKVYKLVIELLKRVK